MEVFQHLTRYVNAFLKRANLWLLWPRIRAVGDLLSHPELHTVPSTVQRLRTKQGQQWGSIQSLAVTLSGMLMSLRVTGGQWAPCSPLAPGLSL